jgi:micrococcal nuclease
MLPEPRRRRFLLLALFALVPALALAQSWQGATYDAVVTRVIDGDTIEVRLGDHLEKVRYIGINTPEIHSPTRGREPYGETSAWANSNLVNGQAVRLVLDVQPRDRFGRLLAYVYVGNQFINAELVRRGYAEVATYPPNVRHYAEFVELQRQARSAQLGLWGDPAAVATYEARPSGVVGVHRLRVYLHPSDPNAYARDPSELVYFESPQEARAAGYTHSMDYHRHVARERQALAGGGEPYVGGYSSSSNGSSASGYTAPTAGGGTPTRGGDVSVHGYTRSDGTPVGAYTRSAPGHGRR